MRKREISETILVICVVLICAVAAVPRLLHPSLHMDESYFIGAARAITSGDIFLQEIGLDKSFLTAWLLIPSLMIFGENALGFHFGHFIFYLIAVALIFSLVLDRMSESRRILRLFFAAMCALVFGLHPWSIAFMAGSFSDGAFLCIVVYYFRKLLQLQEKMSLENHVIFILFLFCIKQTAILLLPIPIILLMHRELSSLRSAELSSISFLMQRAQACVTDLVAVFRTSRMTQVLCAIFLLYSLFGQTKFEAVLYLFDAGLSHSRSRSESFLSFLEGWSGAMGALGAWSDGLIALLILISVVFGVLALVRQWRTAPVFVAVGLSFVIHLFMIAQDSRQYGRYYLFLWIHFWAFILMLPATPGFWRNARIFLLSAFCVSIASKPSLWSRELPVQEWAYQLEKVRDILPRESVLHESSLNWYLRAYRDNDRPLRTRDLTREAVQEERIGRPGSFFQYALAGKPEDEANPRLVVVEEIYPDLGSPTLRERIEGFNSGLSESVFKSRFRMGSWETVSYRSLDGGILELVARRQTRIGNVTVVIQGQVFLSRGRLAENELGSGRTLLTLELLSMNSQVGDGEFLSLMPIATALYGSRFFALGPVGLELRGPADVTVERIDAHSGMYALQVVQRLQNPVTW